MSDGVTIRFEWYVAGEDEPRHYQDQFESIPQIGTSVFLPDAVKSNHDLKGYVSSVHHIASRHGGWGKVVITLIVG